MRLKFSINRRDAWASGLLCALGLGTVLQGSSYSMGTMSQMGPGFFPVLVGALLMLVGLLCLIVSGLSKDEEEEEKIGSPEWRGWFCIVAGVLAFIALGQYGGLVPATFALVFISALGDRTHTLRSALLLSVFVTIIGIVIFSWGLELQFPMFSWG
ncbi:tripartite tricarboxylate transporter TctB family protein [Advenella mimigardefordensis]|uniref:Putative membrane protein n=1 Tax=Advenella mimigardefordensis (strain DSM 17166 / LMG 22922 / DPN7) TaxID=1247726 RepID=W0PFH2_ADVMD|nr:tripartite tricarboxylate transporter TctB family protein [Advenella mimigardefordensis]AHG63803.1 putative membrane protein [Advenella mimigardefordensis DPN7]